MISFLESFESFIPDPFPLGDGSPLIAPFWGDVDEATDGTLYYREIVRSDQSEDLFQDVDDIVRDSFVTMRWFSGSWMFLATWDRVSYANSDDPNIVRRPLQCFRPYQQIKTHRQ